MSLIKENITQLKRIARNLFGNMPHKIRGGLADGYRIRGVDWILPKFKQSKEEKFLKSLNFQNKIVYDVGGYMGIFSLFFSKVVGPKGKVITFEPNPFNYKKIKQNLFLNKIANVQVYLKGIGDKKEKRSFALRFNESGTGSMDREIGKSIAKEKGSKFIEVEIDSLDNLFEKEKLPAPNFIKVDVEGLEVDVLKGMKKIIKSYHPTLQIEIHGVDLKRKIQNAKEVVHFLFNHNYKIYHIESNSQISTKNIEIAKEGHLFAYSKNESP